MGKDDKKDMEGAAGTRDIVKETKGMMFQEAMSKFMDEGKAKGRKIQNIFEEIDKLGMTEDECWKEAMETGLGKDLQGKRDKRAQENRQVLKNLMESGKEPKQKLQEWMRYLSGQAAMEGMKEVLQKKKNSTYRNWGQWNYNRTKDFEKVAAKNGLAAAIFMYMARKSDKYNKLTCPYKVFEEEFGVSGRSVGRAIRLLEENSLVTIYKSGPSNVYVLDDKVTWKSEGWRHDYCEFDSRVVKARSEQREERRKKWEGKNPGKAPEEGPGVGDGGHPEG